MMTLCGAAQSYYTCSTFIWVWSFDEFVVTGNLEMRLGKAKAEKRCRIKYDVGEV
jgi:hypothetical protein